MFEILVLLFLFAVLILFGSIEYYFHTKRRERIPIRIHVNGTRGKSSVTRLIAAGLREGGLKVFAKTTGTLPIFILPDGSERDIRRFGVPNILEQKDAIEEASLHSADAIVLECMALIPLNQKVSEEKLISATHAVITNIREDHLEIMGPSLGDVALAISGSIPKGQVVFTTEKEFLPLLQKVSTKKRSRLISVSKEKYDANRYMQNFAYYEHFENVILALEVCESLGVTPDIAIRGMWASPFDLGASFACEFSLGKAEIRFVNGFAANDPYSAQQVWDLANSASKDIGLRIALVNCRKDRPERSEQMAKEILSWKEFPADLILCTGEGTSVFANSARKLGSGPDRLVLLEDTDISNVFLKLEELVSSKALVVGLGNIGGLGIQFVQSLQKKEGLVQV
ncbi:poly-gamma-glutamate synthase PgsB [Leptospira langatensis]|uniref:Poly-gamma-glutamate synthase PgsB n=1 Tax=Leptospira langatensis TaxID=2484983 RepID=A0A5F1ZYU2_9LEPT|nr:poly-gamma-glutamate synthase PgsB [Leptospira langatensis]TGJ98505.1 poly-gamma-glutamate synthase PgsB [Leptospira langatensis]TGL43420.1 poly-gamma-glutamate synthase PgsB [Leptospira langatensis]